MLSLKDKSAIMLFNRHTEFKKRNSRKSFWARGYYVVIIENLNESIIIEYICKQEENDKLEK